MPEKNHTALLTEFIAEMENEDLQFYRRTASRNYKAWHVTAVIAFLSSVGSALAAALMKESDFDSYGRKLLIALPILGAAATGILHLFKFREKEALREEGRIEIEDIIANAKSLLASCTTENDAKVAFHQVRERHHKLEIAQHHRDTALRADKVPRVDA